MVARKLPPALELEIQRVDLLYRQNTTGAIAILVNTIVFPWIAWSTTSHTFLIIWAAILNLSFIVRILATWRWNSIKSSIDNVTDMRRWHRLMVGCLLVSGAGWGAIGVASVQNGIAIEMIFACAFLFGMSAGALATYAPSLPAMYSVLIPATLPFAISMFATGKAEFVALGFMVLFFMGLMIRIGRNLNNYVMTSLRLHAAMAVNQERLLMARDSSSAVNWEWDVVTDSFICEGHCETLMGAEHIKSGLLHDCLTSIRFKNLAEVEEQFRASLASGSLDIEAEVLWPGDGVRWIAIRGKTHYRENYEPLRVAGICWDVTAKKAQEKLRHERDLLETANQAKVLFLANVSHEIRTPLAAINGFAESVLDSHNLPEPIREDMDVILRNGNFLVSMVNDLLDLSKSETDGLFIQKANMSPLREIHDSILVIQNLADRKQLVLEVVYDSFIPETITADAVRFRQVLINLLTNAVKYTDRGRVTLRISCRQVDGGEGVLRVLVEDTGMGMDPEAQSHLFQPFARGTTPEVKRVPGSGLGLALSRSLARRMEGDVNLVRSALGEGASFEVTIGTGPLTGVPFVVGGPYKAANSGSSFNLKDQRRLAGRKVLLAEDDPDLSDLMQRFLSIQGAEIEVVENGLDAVERALLHPFDIILMDIKMPVMDGYRATSTLREKGYRNSIVALTAHASTSDQERCYQAGCDSYLSKPVDRNHLLEVINRQLEHSAGAR